MRLHRPAKTADSKFSSSRIEAFSDGVIAIIITLMVLEIKPPTDLHHIEDLNLRHIIGPMAPHLVAYFISFVMLGIYWVNHHNFFHKIKNADRRLLWLNLNLLFWMSLIPIPTAIVGDLPQKPAASLMYGIVMFMTSASFTYMGMYANKKKLFTEQIPEAVRARNMRRNLTSLGIYVVAMIMAYINIYISFGLYILVAAMFFMPKLGIQMNQAVAQDIAPEEDEIHAPESSEKNDEEKNVEVEKKDTKTATNGN